MQYLIPVRWLLATGPKEVRAVTAGDLERAHEQATRAVAGGAGARDAMRRESVRSILLAGVMPLTLHIAFDVPFWLLYFLMCADVLLAAAADTMIRESAPIPADLALLELARTEHAWRVARTVGASGGRRRRSGSAASFVQRGLHDSPGRHLATINGLALPLFLLIGVVLVAEVLRMPLPTRDQLLDHLPVVLPGLALDALMRLGSTARTARRARGGDNVPAALLPQLPVPLAVLMLSTVLASLFWLVVDVQRPAGVGGIGLLVLVLGLHVALALLRHARLRRADSDFRRWLRLSPEQRLALLDGLRRGRTP